MKTGKRVFAGIAAIMICGFAFTGCPNGDEEKPNVAVSGVALNEISFALSMRGTKTLTATVLPGNASNKNVSWSSDNITVATVANGIVTAKAKGNAKITVITQDGKKTATCTVTVNPIPVTGVTLSPTEYDLNIGETVLITPTVEPPDAYNMAIDWTSSDTSKATVINGTVTGIAAGDVTITVTTHDGGKTATCDVTVIPIDVTNVTLDITALPGLPEGDIRFLTPTIEPPNASYKTVTWTSSNESAAIVNTVGMVTAVAPGTTTIKVITDDGDFEDECAVTVVAMPDIPGMVKIKAGIFIMGSPENELRRDSDEILHQITLTRGFYMGEFPVTQAEYEAVTGLNPSYNAHKTPVPPETDTDNRPVDTINWFNSVEFCNRLSVKEGLTPVYTITDREPALGNPIIAATITVDWNANGYRLPTEAEWEYACRADTTTAMSMGDRVNDTQANYNASFLDDYNVIAGKNLYRTTSKGDYPANPWGLYDMHGNVWEWCWDWYAPYPYGAQIDPRGPDSGVNRVSRGSAFFNPGYSLRTARRGLTPPHRMSEASGFRVVRTFVPE
jgi:uncharacterized protein YjdB